MKPPIGISLMGGLAVLLLASSCASISGPPAPATLPDPAPRIPGSQRPQDPLHSLDTSLSKVTSDRVVISRRFLQLLVRSAKQRDNQCRELTEQLREIKSVDFDEAGPSR